MIRVYNIKTSRHGTIRKVLAGVAIGVVLTAAAVYLFDGPIYTDSEITCILAHRVNPDAVGECGIREIIGSIAREGME
jgi:hypothetical protein